MKHDMHQPRSPLASEGADAAHPPAYRLSVDLLGVRQTSWHPQYDSAHRALISVSVQADLYLYSQPADGRRRRYILLRAGRARQRGPRVAGHAIIEPLDGPGRLCGRDFQI